MLIAHIHHNYLESQVIIGRTFILFFGFKPGSSSCTFKGIIVTIIIFIIVIKVYHPLCHLCHHHHHHRKCNHVIIGGSFILFSDFKPQLLTM